MESSTPVALRPVPDHYNLANALRFLAADAVEKANSGHPGMPMGMADVATVLFSQFLKFDPKNPRWPDRDRFVLSAGHGSMLLYALLYLTGYQDCDLEQIKNFRQLGSRTAGHPEFGHLAGIETTTGPLGQGLANAVGMAIAEQLNAARYGDNIVDHYTYVIAGDGCLMEGISQEAISLAGHLKLHKLIVLWDSNNISIDGHIGLASSENQLGRFAAAGWATIAVNGHEPRAVALAIRESRENNDRPTLIACLTTIAYGAPTKAGTHGAHGAPLGKEELAATREALNWPHPPFQIPPPILNAWRAIGARGADAYNAWIRRKNALPPSRAKEFDRRQSGTLPPGVEQAVLALKQKLTNDRPTWATRKASQAALEVLVPQIPELIGGSADLTGSNLTQVKDMAPITEDDYAGRYIHYGVREHGMAATMNGLALHGGVIPYGGTFLVFTDYLRPALRLSALMGQRVIYVMTHDSIGLGEDGPTHQPVEHLAALRAIPNLSVFRPADSIETLECWHLALKNTAGPSLLALSRQNLPLLRTDYTPENLCARGGYVLSEAEGERQVTLIATGSEVSIAVAAQKLLSDRGIAAAVVSLPCWKLFDAQPEEYRAAVLGETPRVAVEAALSFGWEHYLGPKGRFIGMTDFGASGPAEALYSHFGITAEAIAAAAEGLARTA